MSALKIPLSPPFSKGGVRRDLKAAFRVKYSYGTAVLITVSIFCVVLFSGQDVFAEVACPPPLKMVSSSPRHLSEGASTEGPVIMSWDNETLETLSDGLRDLKPALESVNIAGGRYGMGTLLTTEWGIGGTVSWKENVETITPEAPLEPGTQYRLWTYLYLTIRDGKSEACARIGGEVVFKTAGIAPDDGNPVRKIDLSGIYHGDKYGQGDIHGRVTGLNSALGLLSVDDEKAGRVSLIIYKGIPVFRNGEFTTFDKIQVGDKVAARFTGGRVVTVEINK